MEEAAAQCRRCGTPLDADGTCAACLLAAAFDPDTDTPNLGEQPAPPADLNDEGFGPYRIVRLLAEGGMGGVYLAEQTRPIQRIVALKVVKLGVSSAHILARFDYERQALALMDHPNIAHVYDAGASTQGRPYFVMEYVDGLPITHYCDQHRLDTRQRIELFVPVCLALQHAHQKGVIHRDIKPSNVLVTEIDGRATPKVIDFGIARAIEQPRDLDGGVTLFGQFMGTPEYMSPEQGDLVTGDIDTRSDVYSLGVLLYELLIGAVPFDAARLRKASLPELLRIIREEDPAPMTARLTGMGATIHDVAGRRRTDPATLRRLVQGDLNWVTAKAMEKDRARRYAAASDLAADLRRHLDDQPVLASPHGAVYQASKFVRRYKRAVIAAAAVLVALVAGIVATTWQAAIARRERAEAVSARGLAEARLNDVHALAEAMLFEINDDVKDLAGGTKAREALVRLGQQYLNKEAALRESDPRRRQTLAEAFLKVGDLQGAPGESNLRDVAGARQSYARAAAILESEVAAFPHQPHLRHLLTLAYVRQAQLEESAQAARTFGSVIQTFASSFAQFDDTESPARSILDRAAQSAAVYSDEWPNDPQGQRDRGEVLQSQGRFAEAVVLRTRILAASPADPVLRWELARTQLALGTSLVLKNRREALRRLRQGADTCEALSHDDPANVQYQRERAVALGTMTRVLLNLSRLPEAVASARQSVAILEQLTASDSRSASFRLDLSAARVALSNAYYDSGQAAQALENVALAAAVQQEQAARYPGNPDFPRQAAFHYRNGARFKTYMRDFTGALALYRKAEALDRALTTRYPKRLEFQEALRGDLEAIGGVQLSLGDSAAALGAYRDAFTVAQAAAAESPVTLAAAHQGLANGFKAMARWPEAIQQQSAAIAIWQRRTAAKPRRQGPQRALARAREELARLYDAAGDLPAAVTAAEQARPFLEADFTAHPDDEAALTELRNALLCLRIVYLHTGQSDRAVAVAQQISRMAARTGVISRAAAARDLGDTLLRAGRRDEALAAFRRAMPILDEDVTPPDAGHSYPIEKEPSPYYRNELANSYLGVIAGFIAAGSSGEAAALLNRIVPVLEALVRTNPGNDLYRDTLQRACHSAAGVFLRLGDVRRSLDFEQRALAPRSTQLDRAQRLTRIGSLQLRLGMRDPSRKTWQQALATFQQAAADADRQWSVEKKDQAALHAYLQAQNGTAYVLECLGDPHRSAQLRTSLYQREPHSSPAAAVLAAWRYSGPQADFRPFFGGAPPSPAQLDATLAAAWRDEAQTRAAFAAPIPAQQEAAAHAIDFSRRVVTENATPTNRLALAQSLRLQADTGGTGYSEARTILTALQRSGQLTPAGQAELVLCLNGRSR